MFCRFQDPFFSRSVESEPPGLILILSLMRSGEATIAEECGELAIAVMVV